MNKNYYEILEVDRHASEEIIKKAYNTLAKKYHPDLQSSSLKSICEEKFKLINEAYETLSIPEKREEYDCSLEQTTISKEDFDAIYLENQKLKKIIRRLKNELSQNNSYTNNINYNIDENTSNYNYQSNYKDNYANNKNNAIYETPLNSKIKNIISIALTIAILFLLWKIPFIRTIIKEFIFIN